MLHSQNFDEKILYKHVIDTIKEDFKSFNMQMDVHFAHVIMLYEQNIITKQEAGSILGALFEIENDGPESIPIKEGLTDLYSNLEEFIVNKIGIEVGGKLHIARSRNDMNITIERMFTRDSLIKYVDALIYLMETLLVEAEKHKNTIIPGYTHHSQHAQPTTLGHFYLNFFHTFKRDIERAEASYKHSNICSMGGAALTTTGFPINRQRVSELLAFIKPVEHSMDATSSLDFQYESASAMAIFINNVGRMIESLLLWNIREVGLVRLALKYCSYSTIMPQKRNPVALETLRYSGEWTYGALSTMFNTLKAFTPGNGREPGFVTSLYMEISEKIIPSIYLLEGIVRTLEVNKERGLEITKEGFSTMTELADELVRSKNLSFYAAKKIVGKLVVIAHDEKIPCEKIDSNLIKRAAREALNIEVELEEEKIKTAIDPEKNIQERDIMGGPAVTETERMVKEGKVYIEQMRNKWTEIRNTLEKSHENLRNLAKEIIG